MDGQDPEQIGQGNALLCIQQGEKLHLINQIRDSHGIPCCLLHFESLRKQTVDVDTSTVCLLFENYRWAKKDRPFPKWVVLVIKAIMIPLVYSNLISLKWIGGCLVPT